MGFGVRQVDVTEILTRLGDPTAQTLPSLTAKWGDIARTLDGILGSRWDSSGDLGTDIVSLLLNQGLVYYGVVTAVPGANQFTIAALAGLGAGKFNGATNPYQAFVFRDAGGAAAAPQGEMKAITAYTTATGAFTTSAFTAAVAVSDEILILHPRLAEIVPIKTQTDKIPNFEQEVEWASTPTVQQVASAAATNLTAGSITPTFPTGATAVRVVLLAVIHAANQAANAHHINLKVQGQKAAGGYSDLIDLTAQATLSLAASDGSADGWSGAVDVTTLVDTSAAAYTFRFVADSDNAGAVNYTCSFVLALIYHL